MSYFSFTSVWNSMSDMLTNVAETIGAYVNADVASITESEAVPEQMEKSEKKEDLTSTSEVEKKDVDVAILEEIEEDMKDFDVIADHDLYVVLYEQDGGIVTEENVFIDLEESTRYH